MENDIAQPGAGRMEVFDLVGKHDALTERKSDLESTLSTDTDVAIQDIDAWMNDSQLRREIAAKRSADEAELEYVEWALAQAEQQDEVIMNQLSKAIGNILMRERPIANLKEGESTLAEELIHTRIKQETKYLH